MTTVEATFQELESMESLLSLLQKAYSSTQFMTSSMLEVRKDARILSRKDIPTFLAENPTEDLSPLIARLDRIFDKMETTRKWIQKNFGNSWIYQMLILDDTEREILYSMRQLMVASDPSLEEELTIPLAIL